MWLKLLIVTTVFFLLGLFQSSFLPHVSIMGIIPNLVFILFFVLVFFEKSTAYHEGIFYTVIAGLVTDIFSSSYFGPGILSLLVTYSAMKILFYLLEERRGKYLFFYFLIVFLVSFILYEILFSLFVIIPHGTFTLRQNIIVEESFNMAIALLVFYFYPGKNPTQLTLFK